MNFRKIAYSSLIIALLLTFVPSINAQANPCDGIVASETITFTPDVTETEIQLAFFERAVVNAYLAQNDAFALTIIDEMIAVDDEYALAYFYEGCIYLDQGNQSDAFESFTTFLEFSDDDDLIESVATFINTEGSDESDEPEEVIVREAGDIALENYQEDGDTIREELETNGLFPSGSNLAFSDGFISYTSDGVQFNNYAADEDISNFLMGATFLFSAEGRSIELCGLIGHVDRAGSYNSVQLRQYLVIGLDSGGSIFLIENNGDSDENVVEVNDAEFNLDEPVQITSVVLDNELTVYANGEVMFDSFDLEHNGEGSFAFYLASGDTSTRCQATGVFGYALPDTYENDACIARSEFTVNRRTGPGTSFERDGEMESGQELEVVSQAQDVSSNGFTWWELEDGAWVREDVVNVEGYCRTLPDTSAE